MTTIADFAAFGGTPIFEHAVSPDQLNLPPWEELETALRGIFARRYFANGGPLVRRLDERFAEFLGVGHAVCVTNETVALMILAKAFDLRGEAVVPAFSPRFVSQALAWAGLTPVECDVDESSLTITAETVAPHLTDRTVAVVGTHAFGRPCDANALAALAKRHGLAVFFDATQALGCADGAVGTVGALGQGEVFSFQSSAILDGAEGGCITTNDEPAARKFRTIRNFYVPAERVPLRINGKMAEGPPALLLAGMQHFQEYVDANSQRYEAYAAGLEEIPGVRLLDGRPPSRNTYQSIVAEIDEERYGLNRDELRRLLLAENAVLGVPFDRTGDTGMPVSDGLFRRLALLPNTQRLSPDGVRRLCERIADIGRHAAALRTAMRERS
jgi:dTDP-4-amino-4,6-dideoxygalactose transaminase